MNANRRSNLKSFAIQRRIHHNGCRAFTLAELLVVLATLGILAGLLVPALADTRPGSKSFQCLNNMRQLGLACSLYSNDNHDRLVTNSDRNGATVTRNWICPYGAVLDWTANSNNTNTFYLTVNTTILGQQVTALIGSYVANSTSIFLCPADNYLSTIQRSIGWKNRIRTCAMNGAMGDGSKWFGVGNGGHSTMPLFYNAKKLTDMHNPGPANCWVIMDEHPDANDDCVLYVNPADANGMGTTITELPGSLHGKAAGMVFADGHSDLHRWTGSVDTPPVKYQAYAGQSVSVTGDTGAANDLTWLAQHTPQN